MSERDDGLCTCSHARHQHSPKGKCRLCVECNSFYPHTSKRIGKIEREEIDDLRARQLKLITRIRWERDYALERVANLEQALRRVRRYLEYNDHESITSILDDVLPKKTETEKQPT